MTGADGAGRAPAAPARPHVVATDISPQPAVAIEGGFRLLVLRQLEMPPAPPAFAVIDQRLVRSPLRPSRHGMAFAIAFRPEIVAWLSATLGRPSLHDAQGRPQRNPRWPQTRWAHEERLWDDGTRTIDWSMEAIFPEDAAWGAFAARWSARLEGARDEGAREESSDKVAGGAPD